MDFLVILRMLRQRRILVATGAIVAIVVGLHVAGRASLWPPALTNPQHISGTATARVLIDRPDSLLADSAPEQGDSLATRAILMANLMASAPVKGAIARDARVPPGELAVMGPPSDGLAAISPLAEGAARAEATAPTPNVVKVGADGQLPIVTISASAPGAGHAAKLVAAGIRGLRSVAASQHAVGGRVVAKPLGTPQVREVASSPKPAPAIAAAIAVFAFWCLLVAIGMGVSRAWRRTNAADRQLA
jgi:hypothetical protein